MSLVNFNTIKSNTNLLNGTYCIKNFNKSNHLFSSYNSQLTLKEKTNNNNFINYTNSKTNNRIFNYTGSSQAIKNEAGEYFHNKGTYKPKRGDIAIWTNTDNPSFGHIGIVTEITPTRITIIEGNSGNRVKKNIYTIDNLNKTARFSGFIDMSSWSTPERAEKAAKVAEKEEAKGVKEINSSNDSPDIRRYKLGAKNNDAWCAYFTSYCFYDGQKQIALA